MRAAQQPPVLLHRQPAAEQAHPASGACPGTSRLTKLISLEPCLHLLARGGCASEPTWLGMWA